MCLIGPLEEAPPLTETDQENNEEALTVKQGDDDMVESAEGEQPAKETETTKPATSLPPPGDQREETSEGE